MEKVYEFGIWTPTAHVLCYDCHNDKYEYDRKKLIPVKHAAEPIEEFNAVTHCDMCNKEIQIDSEVAHEHNVVKTLQDHGIDAEMEQTGGMNSACVINLAFDHEGNPVQWISIKYGLESYEDNNYYACWMDSEGEYDDITTTSDIDELMKTLWKWSEANGHNI